MNVPPLTYPTYTVDGVPMDSTGWYLTPTTRRRPLPAAKAVAVEVPGRAGQLPVLGLDVEATTITLGLFVTCCRPDGTEGDLEALEHNLAALYSVFGVRHRLLDVRHMPAPGIELQASATVLAAADPDVDIPNRYARMQVVLTIPGTYWRDVSALTWAGKLPAAAQTVTPLAGSTAPIVDALVRITGPATNPKITDVATGVTLAYAGAITGGQRVLVDCENMRAARVSTNTWDLAGGTDVTGSVDSTGPGSASRWLHLTPAMAGHDPFSRAITVTTTATGTSGASAVEIRARRAHL
ncbi:hypothetical protein [Microbispora sp. CA-102843]|uniref:hypothetical protein n=1 Tax=Microbispora sp. CA-102843 TaxID=3239952 RepID=UPI003D8AEACD